MKEDVILGLQTFAVVTGAIIVVLAYFAIKLGLLKIIISYLFSIEKPPSAKKQRKELIKKGVDPRTLLIVDGQLFVLDFPLKPGEEKDFIAVNGELMRKQVTHQLEVIKSDAQPVPKETLDTPSELEAKREALIKSGVDKNALEIINGVLFQRQKQGDSAILLEATLDAPNYAEAEKNRGLLIDAGIDGKSLVIVEGKLYQRQPEKHGDAIVMKIVYVKLNYV